MATLPAFHADPPDAATAYGVPQPVGCCAAAAGQGDDGETRRQIDDALIALRGHGRCAVHILDVRCGCGEWLVRAALRAASLGFVAVDARGFDEDAVFVERARATVRRLGDPRIGICFDVASPPAGLCNEQDHGADIILYHEQALPLAGMELSREREELSRIAAGPIVCVAADS